MPPPRGKERREMQSQVIVPCPVCGRPLNMTQATETMLGRKVKVVSEECGCGSSFRVFLDSKEIYKEG